MKIYLAGERAAMATSAAIRRLGGEAAASIWTKHVKRRLFSYYYHGYEGSTFEKLPSGLSTAIADSIEFGWDLFLDSGAFTAFTQGVEIPIESYARFIRRSMKRNIWTTCSSLDAIGSGEEAAKASYENFYALWKHLPNEAPLRPVFHVREPDHWLETYLREGWDYIFIGGMVPETTRYLRVRLDELWHKYLTNDDGTARVKVHGFGLTDMQLMFRYPWHSVDSSSWLMTGIFGSCMFRDDTAPGRLRKVVFSDGSPQERNDKSWHYKNLSRREGHKEIIDSWVEPYGITPEQLSQSYYYRDVVNAAVFQSLEDYGTDRFILEQMTLT